MEELLKKIGITEMPNKTDDGNFVIDILDSDEYAKYYSKLDRSDLVEEDDDSSQMSLDSSSIQYISNDDKYTLTLLADFEGDTYSLVIREN